MRLVRPYRLDVAAASALAAAALAYWSGVGR